MIQIQKQIALFSSKLLGNVNLEREKKDLPK